MAKLAYIKLGKKAQTFFDPSNGISITSKEVLEVKRTALNSKKTEIALRQGHLSYATEVEFEKFQETSKSVVPQVTAKVDPILERKNKELEEENTQLRAELEAKTEENTQLRGVIDSANQSNGDEVDFDDMKKADLQAYLKDDENGFEEKDINKGMKLNRDELQEFIEELEEEEE